MYSGQQEQQHASSSSSTIRDNLSRVFKLSRPRSSSIAIINNDNETNMSRFSFDGIVESKEVVDNTQQVTRQTHLWSFFTAAKQKNTNNHKSSGSESSTSLVLTMDPSVIGALESELVDDHKQEQQQLLTDMMALATHIESFCQDDTPSNNIDDTPTAAQLLAVPYPKSSSTVKKHRQSYWLDMFSSKGRIKIITMKKNSNSIKAEQQDTTTEINNNNIIIMNEKKKFKSDNSETEVEMVSIQISQLARSKIATTSTSKNNNDTSIAASHHSQQDSGVDFPMSVSELEELTRTPHVYSSVGEHMKRELQVAMIDGAILMSS